MSTPIGVGEPALREALWTRACEAVVVALAGPQCQGYADALGAVEAHGGTPAGPAAGKTTCQAGEDLRPRSVAAPPGQGAHTGGGPET